jgi:hypothetical protein
MNFELSSWTIKGLSEFPYYQLLGKALQFNIFVR